MKLLFTIIMLFNFSCANNSINRNISSEDQKNDLEKIDLKLEANRVIDVIKNDRINNESCFVELQLIIENYKNITPLKLDLEYIKKNGQELLGLNFEARQEIHSLNEKLNENCRKKIKEINFYMRRVDDIIGVNFYNFQQIKSESIDYTKELPPIYAEGNYNPFHLNNKLDSNSKFEFKTGDLLITKGVSVISSTISEVAAPKSLFSHIVFVYVDKQSKEVFTLESYVGKGVGLYKIEEALKNENARIVVLRPKDQKLASEAAEYMYNRYMLAKKRNKVIYYDYDLNFEDNIKMSCEELAYDAYKFASRGKMIIPELPSFIPMTNSDFLSRIGLKYGPMMIPADLETDTRFEVMLDWTDYRVSRDSTRKDAILGEIINAINDRNYRIHENFTSVAASAVWSTRYIPGLWHILAKASGLPVDFTKDVPSKTIMTIASLKIIGNIIYPVAEEIDVAFFKKNGFWMGTENLRFEIAKFISSHPKELDKVFKENKN